MGPSPPEGTGGRGPRDPKRAASGAGRWGTALWGPAGSRPPPWATQPLTSSQGHAIVRVLDRDDAGLGVGQGVVTALGDKAALLTEAKDVVYHV